MEHHTGELDRCSNASCTALQPSYITYDHRILRTRLPVRSAIYKQDTGGLVLRWVTTGEYLLLYVFVVFFVKFFFKFLCGRAPHDPHSLTVHKGCDRAFDANERGRSFLLDLLNSPTPIFHPSRNAFSSHATR
ncbi:hypothetical protein CC80DRAFT_416248 [Byssothecium circinans]|uniref:Uncharacterized protein n=1 Tax=Byssothecium circinans TaxID=147558 RepID=A0A6A5TPY9_9PLEO|nr:hypothetical protein CC80DRAFT_416248 [Byssothecium circinans]